MSTELIWEVVSTGSADTEKLGELIGLHLQVPQLIELCSDLGGGKTTFVRGLARGLGSKDIVSSPTFTISKTYRSKEASIHHYDFYRLNEAGVIKEQLSEAIDDSNAVVVVEWSDIVKNALPQQRLTITLQPTANDPDERSIEIKYPQALGKLIKQVESEWEGTKP